MTDPLRSIAGKGALVTGAASGIGRATAQLFAREGARVAVVDRHAEAAEAVAAAIREAGGEAIAFALDVADAAAVAATVGRAGAALGGLDLLVNNAGIGGLAAPDDGAYDEVWDRQIAVLLTAHQRTVRAALPFLRRSAVPRIVNIGSTESLGATARNGAYAAAKHGVVGLTRALAVDLGREGITVNCVCPGPIRTGLTERISEEDKAAFARRRTALRRYGEPAEVAHVILSLCLPAASYITGAVVPVDGGLTARNA